MSPQIGMTRSGAAANRRRPGNVTRARVLSGVLSLQYSETNEKDADLVDCLMFRQATIQRNGRNDADLAGVAERFDRSVFPPTPPESRAFVNLRSNRRALRDFQELEGLQKTSRTC